MLAFYIWKGTTPRHLGTENFNMLWLGKFRTHWFIDAASIEWLVGLSVGHVETITLLDLYLSGWKLLFLSIMMLQYIASIFLFDNKWTQFTHHVSSYCTGLLGTFLVLHFRWRQWKILASLYMIEINYHVTNSRVIPWIEIY